MKKILLGFIFSTLFGCNYNHVKGTAQIEQSVGANSLPLDFVSVQSLVLLPQCVRCHSNSGGNQGGLSLETYQLIRANLNKIYFRAIEKKDMPPSPLSGSSFELLKAWLEAGAPEKNSGQSTGPINGPITWVIIKNQVLGSSCLDCHSGGHPDGNINLTTAEEVRKNIAAIFDSTIVKMSMPLEPYPAMSEAGKQALMKWISQGMPD